MQNMQSGGGGARGLELRTSDLTQQFICIMAYKIASKLEPIFLGSSSASHAGRGPSAQGRVHRSLSEEQPESDVPETGSERVSSGGLPAARPISAGGRDTETGPEHQRGRAAIVSQPQLKI